MPNEYIRPIGKPAVEKSTNGLRQITRRYVVHGLSSTEPYVEDRIFEPFCTPDEEYPDALLIKQRLEGSQDASQDVLVRVYLELNDEPAEIDPPDYVRDGVGRVRATKSYLVKTPYNSAWSDKRVGVERWDTPNGDETILAKVTYDEKTCYAEYKEEYFQVGIISFKEQVKHNGALYLRVYRSIGIDTPEDFRQEADLSPEWVLIENMSGSGSTDYQYGGLEVKTWTVVKGAGRIILEEEDKGTAQVTTEVIIVPDGESYAPYSDIPPDQVYETRVEDKDGYDLWTVKGVVGSGEIDRKHEVRYNGALEIITIKNIGQQSVAPAGFVRVSEQHDEEGIFDVFTDVYVKGLGLVSREEEDKGTAQITTEVWITPDGGSPTHGIPVDQIFEQRVEEKDGYEIHTIRGVVGQGEIERKEETRYNGALSIITIKNIGQQSTPPVGYVRISENFDTSGRYDVFTDVYVKGQGLISSESEDKGTAQITREVHIVPNGGQPNSQIPADQVYETRVEEKDGYEIHTLRGVVGSGEMDRKREVRFNGALEILTIKNIGQQSPVPAGFVRVSEQHDEEGIFDVFTDVFVKGLGRISKEEEDKGTAQITTEVWITADGQAPAHGIPPQQVFEEKVEEKDGYEIHTIRGVIGEGEIERSEETKYNGALSIIRIKNIGQQSPIPAGYERISETYDKSGNFDIYSDVYVKGAGLITSESEDKGSAQVTTEVHIVPIGGQPNIRIPQEQVYETRVEQKDGYEIHTIRGVVGDGEVERREETKHNGALSVITIKNIGKQSEIPAGYLRVSESHDKSGQFDIYTDVYAKGVGLISKTEETKGSATLKTEVWLATPDAPPVPTIEQDQIYQTTVDEKDGYLIHTFRGVQGQGTIDERKEIKHNGALEITTIKSIGEQSDVPAGFVRISESHDQSGNFDIFTDVYVKGTGRISRSEDTKGKVSIVEEVHIVKKGQKPVGEQPENEWIDQSVAQKDGYEIYTFKHVSGKGLIEERTETKHNGALSMITYKSIGEREPAPANHVLISEEEDDSGNFTIFTDVYVEGVGMISTTEEKKGSATITTERWITKNNARPNTAIPQDQIYRNTVEEKDGYDLHTLVGVVGKGEIERKLETRKNGKLEILTIKSIGKQAPDQAGFTHVTEQNDKSGNFEVFTDVFVKGKGRVETSKRAGSNNTTVETIVYLTQDDGVAPQGCVTEEEIEKNDGYVLYKKSYTHVGAQNQLVTATRTDQYGIFYPTVTKTSKGQPPTFAKSVAITAKRETQIKCLDGQPAITDYAYTFAVLPDDKVIDKDVTSSGSTVTTKITKINNPPQNLGCVVGQSDRKLYDVDGAVFATIYKRTFIEGKGNIDESVTSSGGITRTTKKSLGAPPLGNGCVVSKKEDKTYDTEGKVCDTIYTYTFLEGSGELERSVTSSGGVTKTRIKQFGAPPVAGGCLIAKSEEVIKDSNGKKCETIYDYTFADGNGELERSVSYSKGVTRTRIKSIKNAPQGQGCLVAKSEEEVKGVNGVCYKIYDYTFAEGAGELGRTVSSSNGVTKTQIKTIGVVPANGGCIVSKSTEEVKGVDGNKCYEIYDWTFLEGAGELDRRVSSNGGLTRTRIKAMGAPPVAGGCIVAKSEEQIKDINGALCDTIYDYEFLDGDGEISRSTRTSGGLTITRVKTIGANAPQNGGCLTGKNEEQIKDVDGANCKTIFEYEFTTGEGELERSVRNSDGITFTTIKTFGGVPQAGGCLTAKSEEDVKNVDGGVCNKIYTRTFMRWQDGILGKSVSQGPENMTITTITSTRQGQGRPANACKMGEESKEFRDIDGKVCFTRYKSSYGVAPSSGEIERTVRQSNGMVVTRIKSVGQVGNAGGCQTSYAEKDIKDMDGNKCFSIYTVEYTKGSGIIDEKVTTRSNGTSVRTVRSMGNPPQGNGCLTGKAEEGVYDKDGSQCDTIYTYTFLEAHDGIVSETTSTNSSGITTVTKVGMNVVPIADTGCLTGKKDEYEYDVNGNRCFGIHTRSFSSGQGAISTKTRSSGGLTYVTIKSVGNQPPQGEGCLVGKTEIKHSAVGDGGGECYTVYEYEYLTTTSYAVIDQTSSHGDNGIKKTTTKTVAAPFDGAGCKVAESSYDIEGIEGACVTVYTATHIEGTGEYDRSVSPRNGYSIVTIRSVGQAPQAPDNSKCLLSSSSTTIQGIDGDCFEKYIYEYVVGDTYKELSRKTRFSDGVLYTTVRKMGAPGDAQGCKVGEGKETIEGEDGTCIEIFETTFAHGQGVVDTSYDFRDGISFTTIKSIGQPPEAQGCVWSKNEMTVKGSDGNDCYTVYNYTFAQGYGEVSRSTKTTCGATLTTVESIDQPPVGAGDIVSESSSQVMGQEGVCFTRYKYTFQENKNATIYSMMEYRTDGSKIETKKAYGTMPQVSGTTMRTGSECTSSGTLYTAVGYTQPSGFTTVATAMYNKKGKISLDYNGAVQVDESPVNQLVVADVRVVYGAVPQVTIEEYDHAPILERTVQSHAGGVTMVTEVMPNYCVQGNTAVEKKNVLFEGVPVASVKSVLKGGKCRGDSRVIRVNSDRIISMNGLEVFRTEIYEYGSGGGGY